MRSLNREVISSSKILSNSLLTEVSICAGNSKEKRPLPRSDRHFLSP